jgi:pimeloyl-ACP methyl ester carboxylesterase
MSTWQSEFVDVHGLQLHYTRTDGDKPPLVLAHGFSDDGLCWMPVAQQLERDFDAIMVDTRGHGRSDGPETGYSYAAYAGDLHGVITALGLRRPAVLGHSMGAATALALAGLHPDVPGAILLEDPPMFWVAMDVAPEEIATWQARQRAWVTKLKRRTREELIAGQHAETPGWPDAELGPWADSKLRLSFNVLNLDHSAIPDWQGLARHVTCPALLITGDPALGAIVDSAGAAALQQLIPQLQVARIAGAGHSIRRDRFEDYMAVVGAFLAEHRV